MREVAAGQRGDDRLAGRDAAQSSCSLATTSAADVGQSSRPSRNPWMAMRGNPMAHAQLHAGEQVLVDARGPRRGRAGPRGAACRRAARSAAQSSTSGGSWKNSPRWMLWEMRTRSWGTTRPAPRLRWPTSLLPIWPSGRPTARPLASSRVRGYELPEADARPGCGPARSRFRRAPAGSPSRPAPRGRPVPRAPVRLTWPLRVSTMPDCDLTRRNLVLPSAGYQPRSLSLSCSPRHRFSPRRNGCRRTSLRENTGGTGARHSAAPAPRSRPDE